LSKTIQKGFVYPQVLEVRRPQRVTAAVSRLSNCNWNENLFLNSF